MLKVSGVDTDAMPTTWSPKRINVLVVLILIVYLWDYVYTALGVVRAGCSSQLCTKQCVYAAERSNCAPGSAGARYLLY